MSKKIKVLTISDHPLSPSGVAHQTKNMIEGMLKTGKFQFVSLGGAIQHQDYRPMKLEDWKDDWVIYPVDGYGNAELVRTLVKNEKPDILWFMTDPRFWGWLWSIEHEIRPYVPFVYYHVWDNYPYPMFNKPYYDSNDFVASISKVTDDIVKTVSSTVNSAYVPHAVDTDVFKRLTDTERADFRKSSFKESKQDSNVDKLVFFWNNRNARRKQSGTLIYWFKEFLDKVGHDKATLIMHTDPKDVNGQDLEAIIDTIGMTDGQVMFSREKMTIDVLAKLYNMADCTINISDAEGFGLGTLESLACETPIIVNMTGGLQEQVTDGKNWFGFGIEPASKAIIGSQDVPYIYEDRMNKDDFVKALLDFYALSPAERAEMGAKGRQHVLDNYNFKTYNEQWLEILTTIHKNEGSWDTRKNYKSWSLKEIKTGDQ